MDHRHDIEAIQLNLLRLAKAIDEGKSTAELLALVAATLQITQKAHSTR